MADSEKIQFEQSDEVITFEAIDEDGKAITCEPLYVFQWEKTGEHYIVYTDNSVDEDGDTRIFASKFNPKGFSAIDSEFANLDLQPIETDEEWDMIEAILENNQASE